MQKLIFHELAYTTLDSFAENRELHRIYKTWFEAL